MKRPFVVSEFVRDFATISRRNLSWFRMSGFMFALFFGDWGNFGRISVFVFGRDNVL